MAASKPKKEMRQAYLPLGLSPTKLSPVVPQVPRRANLG